MKSIATIKWINMHLAYVLEYLIDERGSKIDNYNY